MHESPLASGRTRRPKHLLSRRFFHPERDLNLLGIGIVVACDGGRNLNTFQTEDDYIPTLKACFLALLGQLEAFRNRYPELPWTRVEFSEEEEASLG